ncbi:uncharacterized protein LOC124925445 [Impatiens glandulifera]|uniref:uncharacterized protein LOC124925445 n=1 Tax=Impatiens glandulifera TaxID=253017 RepID=UPI001FB073A8|nr:uncharacterized protein LOC124925445 [Impatiens glandulifera]
MMGERKSVSDPQSRTRCSQKTLGRCNNNVKADNIVLIDLDSDTFDDPIIIDVPQSYPVPTVICIDDEEDTDDESSATDEASDGECITFFTSNRVSNPAPDHVQSSTDTTDDECQFAGENIPPKRTYSEKASQKYYYCLDDESDSDLPDVGDDSDGELMEDSSGMLHKQWEEANLKKKHDACNGRSVRSCLHDLRESNFNEVKTCMVNQNLPSTSTQVRINSEIDLIRGKSLSNPEANKDQSYNVVKLDSQVDIVGESSGRLVSSCEQDVENKALHLFQEETTGRVGSTIINERERFKETEEYKRAMEEEWASRQRELAIQAEEAQMQRRLRKRKKAESLRLIDMEKRQQLRLEEIRETQKKDEENLNMKEKLRAEVQVELSHLERTCLNMATLLRNLGIHVEGGLHPLPNDVRAAYKRAVLSFHPDRASGSDLRKLVEAEEKFKLISRMKEKFA